MITEYKKSFMKSGVIEQVMPVLLLFWSSWFAHFDITKNNESLKAARFISDTSWSLFFMVLGCLHIVVVLRGRRRPRQIFLLMLSLFWILWSSMLFSSNYGTVGYVTYMTVGLACYLTSKRI